MAQVVNKINDAVGKSPVGRFFELEKRNTTFFGELRGATATFMSMAYILAVNPRILSDSGGPCEGEDFEDCVLQVKREYVTATALGSIAGCLLMGILANMPIALAPGGTLLALASSLGYVNEDGDFPRSRWAYASDAIATMIGSLFGLSPVTSYIESGAGVEAGSRTGLTAVFVAFYFFLSIFFAPLIASIPPWATGGALVIVGALMARSLGQVQWHNPTHAVTAFVTVILMPLTYSIAYGLIAGIGSYMIMWSVFKLLSLLGVPEPSFDPCSDPSESMGLSPDVEKSVENEKPDVAVSSGGDEVKEQAIVDDEIQA